ncbi:pyridine nucleotide-disulfide oxidoreductase domain-containing protein 1-like isoform X1 [Clavelina lepadiformis]|uniref:pyridine nucleotide-disulfide oxidoreductase domain-containing protein 1-like isoform X1 n=1 Tax=Clavelina lepadiformis TaxID=159417 RepID=UPI00404109BF
METPVFVVVGGGVAGVSCAETLISYLPSCRVIIVSSSPLVKAVRNVQELTHTLVSFDIEETPIEDFEKSHSHIQVLHTDATRVDHENKLLHTSNNEVIAYTKLCICSGAKQKTIFPENDHVIGIRDTATAMELDAKLKNAKRVVVVGNGGIATELVFQVSNCDVVWVIKDKAISQVFFDPGAAEFFLPFLENNQDEATSSQGDCKQTIKRISYELDPKVEEMGQIRQAISGSALGPDWHRRLMLHGDGKNTKKITVEYECEVNEIITNHDVISRNTENDHLGKDWPVCVKLTNGKMIGCDFVVSATGVTPNNQLFLSLPCTVSSDGGVDIDQNMRVYGINDVYAAGDVCSTKTWPKSDHWIQMRLWTQARQMGIFAAQCMVRHYEGALSEGGASNVPVDICFDLFAHVTKFFGKKVCLLGRYNAQDLEKDKLELLLRTTPREEYIKVILMNGRMQGAILVGESDLEETFENLILNETDLSFLRENLLDPNVDIADYFD